MSISACTQAQQRARDHLNDLTELWRAAHQPSVLQDVGQTLLVRFLTKRFIGEYASNANSLYRKRLSIDGRQLNLEIFDPCSQRGDSPHVPEEPLEWADAFVVVYAVSDHVTFLNAKHVLNQIKQGHKETCKGNVPVCLLGNKQDLCHSRQVSEEEGRSLSLEHRCLFQEVSAAENYLDIARLIRHVMEQMKRRSDCQRYSGKRRKSV
ncbi:RERG/RAS-like b [Electrophorus electricus]|uniref:RERG/RAS-like b n=1 Tax=Electrophorus electricus TaxID=8005 RepID=UPI0015CF92BC|nr:RERG/RAS-like b [Electrophorus electricus]